MHRPAISKAAVSDRLIASEVVEGLEERSSRKLLPAADHEQASCGDPGQIGTRHWLLRHTVAVHCAKRFGAVDAGAVEVQGVASDRAGFFVVVGKGGRQLSGVAWTRFGESEKRSSRRLKRSWRCNVS